MKEKIITAKDARQVRDQLEQQGQKLVFTNGCFDLLHVGHTRYLQAARALGDALVVALNSDTSVRELKGPTRPIHNESDRAEVLAALGCVDYVVIFSNARATSLIEAIQPHVYVKGGDYTLETLERTERAALEAAGSQIVLIPMVEGKSTTNVIAQLRS